MKLCKALSAAALLMGSISARALDLEINVTALLHGLGTSNGADFAQGNLLKIGYFAVSPQTSNFTQLADADVFNNRFDYDFLFSHFVQFGSDFRSGEIFGADDPDYASSQFFSSQVGAPATFVGKNIYLWAFNRTTPIVGSFTSGDEIGIFKSPGIFPSGADETSYVGGINLAPEEFGTAGDPRIIVGSYGIGTVDASLPNNQGGDPLYNTAAVPEPSAAIAFVSGIAMLCGIRRRRA